MTIFTSVIAQNKITDIINDCTTMDDCINAKKVMDDYQSKRPKEKEFIKESRNTLFNKSVDIFTKTRKEKGRY